MDAAKRIAGVDLLRSIAIVGMILYHTAYDLTEFHGWRLSVFTGGWWLLARGTAVLFLLLVGVSFALARHRRILHAPDAGFWTLYGIDAIRGGKLFACALLVTAATFTLDPETYVRFGVLHLIALSSFLLPFFVPLKQGTLVPGFFLLALGPVIGKLSMATSLFLPIGIQPQNFHTVDYFPLIPWFGVILIGLGIGMQLIRNTSAYDTLARMHIPSFFTWPGRHALILYFVHQPIILAILWFVARF